MTITSPSLLTAVRPQLDTLRKIENELQQILLEREEPLQVALISLIAGSNLVLLGPPGTGKSFLVKQVAERFCDGTGQGLQYFVYLLTRFTTPEELFGPVSVHGLKNDTYERITTGKLPEAQIAFLDEIFKSSSAVLNILLTILNEHVFDNGTQRRPVPLISLFGASNEMPQEAQDLEALWDRFQIRLEVGYLTEGGFEKLLNRAAAAAPQTQQLTTMSQQDLRLLQEAARQVTIPPSIITALVGLRRELSQKQGIIASDRRWEQCLAILRAAALREERDTVEEDDLAILRYCLWVQKDDIQHITKMVNRLANPLNAKAAELKDSVTAVRDQALREIAAETGTDQNASMKRTTITVDALAKLKAALKQLEALRAQALDQGRPTKRIDQALAVAEQARATVRDQGEY